jgi:hypothetical protein
MHDDRAQPTVAYRGPAVRDAGGEPDDLVGPHDARLLCAEEEADRTLLRLANAVSHVTASPVWGHRRQSSARRP